MVAAMALQPLPVTTRSMRFCTIPMLISAMPFPKSCASGCKHGAHALRRPAGSIGGPNTKTPHLVSMLRLFSLAMFLLAQAVPFGLIGWAAYRDIKVKV